MNQIPNEIREHLNFQASLLWLGVRLEASVSPATVDEKVAGRAFSLFTFSSFCTSALY